MKNEHKDLESLKTSVVAELEESYSLGYHDGTKDMNINLHTFEKKVQEAYNNGLNDAWKCARKVYDFNYKELAEVFPESDETPFDSYSASEAITRIKEYEEQQKQSAEKIKVGDEVEYLLCGGGKRVITNIDRGEYRLMDAYGNISYADSLKCYKRTCRTFPQLAEILNQLRSEQDADRSEEE